MPSCSPSSRRKSFRHSPKADKRALLRRATYDLIGLPPTPEEMDAFLADESPGAFAKVIDRLLASPRYGERWGRHWLDIARYADTSGDRQNGKRTSPLYPYAWTYRDYVIEAFNDDLPLRPVHPASRSPRTACLRRRTNAKCSPRSVSSPSASASWAISNEMIDDRIDVVTKGLMGLTAACARCHDHKFDPVPTKDYYSLHGVFMQLARAAGAPAH